MIPIPLELLLVTWAWLCQSFMAVLLPHGAFLEEDRLISPPGTAEPSHAGNGRAFTSLTARGGGFAFD